jgi:hypothetical protein
MKGLRAGEAPKPRGGKELTTLEAGVSIAPADDAHLTVHGN